MSRGAFRDREFFIKLALDPSRKKGERNTILADLIKKAEKLKRENEIRPLATCLISTLKRNEPLMLHITAIGGLLKMAAANKLPSDLKWQVVGHLAMDAAQAKPTFSRLKASQRLGELMGVSKEEMSRKASTIVHQFAGFQRIKARPIGKGGTQLTVTFRRQSRPR